MKTIYVWNNTKRRWMGLAVEDRDFVNMELAGFIIRIPEEYKEKGDCAPDLWEFYNAFVLCSQEFMRSGK